MDALYLEDSSGNRTKLWPKVGELPVGLIQETRTYRFEAFGIVTPRIAKMYMGEEELESLMPRSDNSCLWKWQPGFHAGSIDARIVEPGYRSNSISLTTDPSLDKLSRSDFSTMVQEIMEDSFALFSLGQFTAMLGSDKKNRPIEIARLEYVDQRITELEKVLLQINSRPQSALHGTNKVVRLGESQRISGNDILKSYRKGNLVKVSSRHLALLAPNGRLLPQTINVNKNLHLSDTKENREIKYCLQRWQLWLRRMDSSLIKIIKNQEPRSSNSNLESSHHIWRRKIQVMQRKLRRMNRLEFLAEINASKNPPKFSSVYQRDPGYRKFFRIYREFNWGLARIYGDFLNIPLVRTFDLYEIWCFYRILRVCIKLYGVNTQQLEKVFDSSHSKHDIVVRSGVIELQLQNGFVLGFKKQFREFWLEDDGVGSFSRTMEPDIYLSIPDTNNASKKMVVLDAKYRIKTNLNSAIASIHMYRDSIVKESGIEIERQVVSAYLLSPQPSTKGIDWRAAAAPARFFHPEYRNSFKFGAISLSPGMQLQKIESAVEEIVRESK